MLRRLLRHRVLVVISFLLALALTFCSYRRVPAGFVPDEDQGYLIIIAQGPSGASLQHTIGVTTEVERILAREGAVANVFNVNGFSFAGAGSNRAIIFAALRPFDERASGDSAQAIVARLRGPLMGIGGAVVIPFLPPTIQGVGTFGGLQRSRGAHRQADPGARRHDVRHRRRRQPRRADPRVARDVHGR